MKSRFTFFVFLLLTTFCFWSFVTRNDFVLPSEGHPIEIYSTDLKQNLRDLFVRAIESAKTSIDICIYSFTDKPLIKALNQKANEGVQIRVVFDPKASPELRKLLDPKIENVARFGKGLTHCKILVVDSQVVYIGSTNWSTASLKYYGNIVVGLYDKNVSLFAKEKIETFEETDDPLLHRDFVVANQDVGLWFLPDDPHAGKRIIDLIRTAKKTIRVAMFTWTRKDFADELILAKNRGVDVSVIIDTTTAYGASKEVVNTLFKNSLPVYLNGGESLFHYKMMLVDEDVLLQGSANWTKSAFTKNDDCFMVLGGLTAKQNNLLNQLWDHALLESKKLERVINK